MPTPTPKKASTKHPDVLFQKILLVVQLLLFISVYGIIIGLMMMIVIGAYQVLGTLYFALVRRSVWHKRYLIGILIYSVLTALLLYLCSTIVQTASGSLASILLLFVPYGLSIYYYFGNRRYHNIQEFGAVNDFYDEDILDDFTMDQEPNL